MSAVVVQDHGNAIELTIVLLDVAKAHALVNDGTVSPDAWLALERCLQVRTAAVSIPRSRVGGRSEDYQKPLCDLLAAAFKKDLE